MSENPADKIAAVMLRHAQELLAAVGYGTPTDPFAGKPAPIAAYRVLAGTGPPVPTRAAR
jgi:hypothetical protein